MGEPLRWNIPDLSHIPPAEEIRQAVTRERSLTLQFPNDAPPLSIEQQIQRAHEQMSIPDPAETERERAFTDAMNALAADLPEFSVFCSAANWITVMWVTPEQEVLHHADALVRAAKQFRNIAQLLVQKLALVFNVVPQDIDAFFRFGLDFEQYRGSLDDDWEYSFHGFECWFGNCRTGQKLEVLLTFGGERGVLDPYFFIQFLRSTPSLASLAEHFPTYHDMRRAFDVLEKWGYLQHVQTFDWGVNRYGWGIGGCVAW